MNRASTTPQATPTDPLRPRRINAAIVAQYIHELADHNGAGWRRQPVSQPAPSPALEPCNA